MSRDSFYEDLLRPLLFRLDPEDAHNLVHQLLRIFGGVLPSLPYKYAGDDLKLELAGRTLDNPVGIAAGFDKNGHLTDLLGHLGFGFEEVGSLTAQPSQGNPRPRLFRLCDDQALINRLGLNGDGARVVARHLAEAKPSLPIAVNIAKTHDPNITGDRAIEDLLFSFQQVKELDVLYVAINASCPNTREGYVKEKKELLAIVEEIQKTNTRQLPLLIKASPDSSDQLVEDIVEIATTCGVAGYVCGNTTTSRNNLQTEPAAVAAFGNGGLSGKPLLPLALELCKKFARKKSAQQFIIGVGGIASGADAYSFIRAGASAVELYTGLIYKGPSVAKQICEELSGLLRRDGLTLKQAVAADIK